MSNPNPNTSDRPASSSSTSSASSSTSNTSNASSSSRLAPQFAPRDQRPSICGPDAPERPYPIYLRGEVERGFGRGGKDLGCPTANLPAKVLGPTSALSRTGVYYGFARVLPQDPDDPDVDDSLSPGGGIESARSPTSPNQEADSISEGNGQGHGGDDDEGEQDSDYYDEDEDEDDDENEVVLGASPVNTGFHSSNNGNANGNGTDDAAHGSSNGQVKRSNSLRAGVERTPKPKSRQGSRSSTKSNKSIATLMAKMGKSDSNEGEELNGSGSGSGSNSNGLDIRNPNPNSTSTSNSNSDPSRNHSSHGSTSKSACHASSSAKHPRNLSAASSSSSLKRSKKKPRIPLRVEDSHVFPMVMSVGWNPFYNNTTKAAEVHIIHKFARDFYGLEIRVVVLGYIRPEYNYVDRESLIEDIETDKKVGIASLQRRAYQDYSVDPFLGV